MEVECSTRTDENKQEPSCKKKKERRIGKRGEKRFRQKETHIGEHNDQMKEEEERIYSSRNDKEEKVGQFFRFIRRSDMVIMIVLVQSQLLVDNRL